MKNHLMYIPYIPF